MVVAVRAMRMVQVTGNEVIDMITVRHRLVSTPGSMFMGLSIRFTGVLRRASGGVDSAHINHMLVHMSAMHMVQVPVMQIIDVPVVQHCQMAAIRPVNMGVVTVLAMGAGDREGRCDKGGEEQFDRVHGAGCFPFGYDEVALMIGLISQPMLA
jgi:hypothetical protein